MRLQMFVLLFLLAFASEVDAKLVGSAVPYNHGDLELEGYLAYDDSFEGKRPGVLIVHEWWGLNDYVRKRADQLAGMGYVAFALDMYGKGKVTEHPKDAAEWMQQVRSNVEQWRQRALAGLEVLEKYPRTDATRIAALGYCFGGATVQQLAYAGAPLKGIVSFHGPLIAPSQEQAGLVKARILIGHGAADPMTKPEAMQEYIAAMGKSGLDWQLVVFGGAKHAFTNPDADKFGMEALSYNKAADERSFKYMKDFFGEIF